MKESILFFVQKYYVTISMYIIFSPLFYLKYSWENGLQLLGICSIEVLSTCCLINSWIACTVIWSAFVMTRIYSRSCVQIAWGHPLAQLRADRLGSSTRAAAWRSLWVIHSCSCVQIVWGHPLVQMRADRLGSSTRADACRSLGIIHSCRCVQIAWDHLLVQMRADRSLEIIH